MSWLPGWMSPSRWTKAWADAKWEEILAEGERIQANYDRVHNVIPKPDKCSLPQGRHPLRYSNISDHESDLLENQQGVTTRNVTRKGANEPNEDEMTINDINRERAENGLLPLISARTHMLIGGRMMTSIPPDQGDTDD